MQHFKKVVKEYAIRQRVMFVRSKSTPKKYVIRCKVEGWKWRITGTNHMTCVLVKSFVLDHTCRTKLRGNDHPLVTAAWVAQTCLRLFACPDDVRTRMIREYIKMHWGIIISYWKAYNAMNIILEIKCENVEDSYRILPALTVQMMRRNPGSYMRVFRARDLRPRGDDRFVCLFWTFSPSIRSFHRTLRPIILVDGTHLRGKYLGILLIAIGVDGNNVLYPLAFGVVETENENSWRWFFMLLRQYVLAAEMNIFTICSDRHKGLLQAVPNIFPNSHHSYCMRHLAANLRSEFKDVILERLFWKAARTLRESVFRETMEKIKLRNERAHKWISDIANEHWASFYFKGNRYDVLTTNRSECFNVVLKDARRLPIASLVEHSRHQTTDFIQKRHKLGHSWQTKLTHYAEERITLAREESRQYTAYRVGVHEYEVRSLEHTNFSDIVMTSFLLFCKEWL
ncbi:uncharacterized protein LOC143891737 [Tasmannia lanceolata]|uniref:uncharacterized protein LOC143891737 n=1 Tax=Tasmannia lanceolata TaxID=3420 RepID=UPI004063BDC8